MNDEVQNPMTDYSGCDHQGAAPIAAESVVNSADDHGPHKEHEQTVGNRIIGEIEWRDSGDAGNDLYMLNAGEQQDWPQQGSELSRQDQDAQRSSGRNFFRGQCDTEMSDKHFIPDGG